MKTKLLRILSSFLIISFLISIFSVFSFAEDDGGSDDGEDEYTLFVHRTFDEGWAPNNGLSFATNTDKDNKMIIDHEEDVVGNYNYFMRFEAATKNQAYLAFNFGDDVIIPGNSPSTAVLEFSIKADDVALLGPIVYLDTYEKKEVDRTRINLISIDQNQNIVAVPEYDKIDIGVLENKWVNIAFSLNFFEVGKISGTVYYGSGEGYQHSEEFSFEISDVRGGLNAFGFGIPGLEMRAEKNIDKSIGMTFGLDNVKIYSGTDKLQEIADNDFGTKVDRNAPIVVDIQKNAADKSKAQIINEALAMKVGVDYALIRNEKYALTNNKNQENYSGVYGAPVIDEDGNVLVPLELLLDYIGFPYYLHADKKSFDITTGTNVTNITIGRDSAVVDGERIELVAAPRYIEDGENSYIVLALEDVSTLFPGWLAIYDDMGFILIYEDKTPDIADDNGPIVTRETDLQTMVDIMKKFVFETTIGEESNEAYIAKGETVYENASENTSGFSHPYIMANSSTFENLKAAFALKEGQKGYDETLNSYIQSVLSEAESYYNDNANLSGSSYAGIKEEKIPFNPYLDGKNPESNGKDETIADTDDGYDSLTGRLDQIEEYAQILPVIAFAYQITGNTDYAKFAYDWSVALSEWKHWGPGYFDNCAKATASYAIAYDWLYNAYKSLGYDTDVLAAAIYNLGIHDGYVASSGRICEHPRTLGDLSVYNNTQNDRNAVGTYGMITGALAILGYVDDNEQRLYETLYLIGNNMSMLSKNGLDIYAPDGSYAETAKQWEIGTSSFFRMVMALTTATGTDYGFMNTWGMDKTCYFGIYIETPDGFAWNYNDANGDAVTSSKELESLNTDMFNFAGMYYGDDTLIAQRRKQIAAGKSATIFDLVAYPLEKEIEDGELSLDYLMDGIDAYISRSDWDKGAMYVGLMGGENSGNNAQLDSGNFIYHNKGIMWFMDLGGEDPTNTNYANSSERYKFYRACAEGQNVVYIANNDDIAHGQQTSGRGEIVKTFENEHGSYVILDNKNAYSSAIVSRADRGLLVTNDRKTVVIQDEISFVRSQNVYWVAHTAYSIYIDPTTERTAYLEAMDPDGKFQTLRVSIITPSTDLKFSTLEADIESKTLNSTEDSGSVYARDKINRLVITLGGGEFSGIGSFNVSVVFEMVSGRNDNSKVGYEWAMMNTWEPKAYTEEDTQQEQTGKTRGAASKQDINSETPRLVTAIKKKDAFKANLESIYASLTLIEYTFKKFPASLDPSLATHYGDYLDCVDKYEAFRKYVNDSVEIVDNLSNKLTGIVAEEAEEPAEE